MYEIETGYVAHVMAYHEPKPILWLMDELEKEGYELMIDDLRLMIWKSVLQSAFINRQSSMAVETGK